MKTPKGEDGYSGKTTTCGTVTCEKKGSEPQMLKKSNTLPKNQKKKKGNKQKITPMKKRKKEKEYLSCQGIQN